MKKIKKIIVFLVLMMLTLNSNVFGLTDKEISDIEYNATEEEIINSSKYTDEFKEKIQYIAYRRMLKKVKLQNIYKEKMTDFDEDDFNNKYEYGEDNYNIYDKGITITVEKEDGNTVTKKSSPSIVMPYGWNSAQGAVITDKYIVLAIIDERDAENIPEGEERNKAMLMQIDKETYKVVKTKVVTDDFGHANGLGYNSKTNHLYVVKEKEPDYAIYVLDAETLETKTKLELGIQYTGVEYLYDTTTKENIYFFSHAGKLKASNSLDSTSIDDSSFIRVFDSKNFNSQDITAISNTDSTNTTYNTVHFASWVSGECSDNAQGVLIKNQNVVHIYGYNNGNFNKRQETLLTLNDIDGYEGGELEAVLFDGNKTIYMYQYFIGSGIPKRIKFYEQVLGFDVNPSFENEEMSEELKKYIKLGLYKYDENGELSTEPLHVYEYNSNKKQFEKIKINDEGDFVLKQIEDDESDKRITYDMKEIPISTRISLKTNRLYYYSTKTKKEIVFDYDTLIDPFEGDGTTIEYKGDNPYTLDTETEATINKDFNPGSIKLAVTFNNQENPLVVTSKKNDIKVDNDKNIINIGENKLTNEILGYLKLNYGEASISGNQLIVKYKDEIIKNFQIQAEYKLTIDPAGGEYTDSKEIILDYLEDVQLGIPTKEGYTFNGWNIVGEGSSINDNIFTIGIENATITATWIPKKYIVSYSVDGNVLKDTKEVTFGETYGELLIPSKEEYIFVGWCYDTKCTSGILTSQTKVTIAKNHTLYAKWTVEVPDVEKTSEYEIEGNYIKNIPLEFDFSKFDLGLDNIYNVKIYNKDLVERTEGNIATGDRIRIYFDDLLVIEYIAIVKGDVTGTGTSTVSDVAKLYQYLKKRITMEDCYIEAGNVVGVDNEIKINDVAKLYQFIKGKIGSLED